jgi:anti-sigma B factor antagonist
MRKTLPGRQRDNARPPVRWRLTGPIADPLTWDIQVAGKVTVVVVDGELDVDTAPLLSRQLAPLADTGSHLILDLAAVRFCDCAGLSLFLRLQRQASAAGGSLHLTALTAPVRRLITLARLTDVLPIASSPADVIAAREARPLPGRDSLVPVLRAQEC